MSRIRNRIETGFEHLALSIYHNRFKTLAVMGILIIALVSQIPKITIDTSTEGFLHKNDPALVAYNQFRDQFGRDEVIIIAIEPTEVFDPGFLEKLRRLHRELEENVPYLDDITSLVNARNTRGQGDELIVEDFLEHWPQTPEDLEILKRRALANPMYRDMLVSRNGRFTTITIRTQSHSTAGQGGDLLDGFDDEAVAEETSAAAPAYLTDAENTEAVMAAERIARKYDSEDFRVYVAGSPAVTHFLKQSLMRDMRKFVALAVLTAAAFLYLMFRRITGVVFPVVVVVLSLLSTIGLMALTGTAIKVPTQILPSFLLAVGVGTSVHILAIFFQRLDQRGDKAEAIAYALGHSGLAVVMTNVTTASGLISFATAELAPIADLGIFAGVGVLLAFVYTVILLPALLALIPIRPRKRTGPAGGGSAMDRLLISISRFSTTHPVKILVFSALLVALSIVAASSIRFSHYPLEWLPETDRVRIATEKIDHELRGSLSMEMVIDTGKENGLYEVDLLDRMEAAGTFLESLAYDDLFVGKAWSVTTILKEINQALHENRPEHYAIPRDRDLVAQELLLFENSGSDDLEDFVDSQFSKGRLIVKVPFKDAVKYGTLLDRVTADLKDRFPHTRIEITGMMVLLCNTISNAIVSMARSYAIALVVITALMVLLIGKVRIGLLSMIPNLAPILLTMGVIGALDLPMDLFTMMVASIAIGLAVDDTIHFMHNFRRYYEQTGDPALAVEQTLATTGRAMMVTSIVLSIGFFLYAFSAMNNIVNFGMLTGFTILMALASDYFLAPALMVLVNRKGPVPAATMETTENGTPVSIEA
jgi:uncharacterized protein